MLAMVQTILHNNLPATSRVWIYQANRILTDGEVSKANELIQGFLPQWKSHGKDLAASIEVLHNLFIVVTADEGVEAPSGCSIDSSVKLVKEIAATLNVDFFDRLVIPYLQNDKIQLLKMFQFQEKLKAGELNEDTVVFNNLVDSKAKLESAWVVPVKESWHKQLL
jgi:hypothetical protein